MKPRLARNAQQCVHPITFEFVGGIARRHANYHDILTMRSDESSWQLRRQRTLDYARTSIPRNSRPGRKSGSRPSPSPAILVAMANFAMSRRYFCAMTWCAGVSGFHSTKLCHLGRILRGSDRVGHLCGQSPGFLKGVSHRRPQSLPRTR